MANDGKKEVMGVVLFFCAIILGLMYYLPEKITGVVGNFLRSVGFGFFGYIAMILPCFLFYAAIDLFIEKRERVAFTRVKAAVLILVCSASLFAAITMNFDHFRALCIPDGKETPAVTKAIQLLWKSGLEKDLIRVPGESGLLIPGGLIGGLIAVSIESVCGKVVTILIMIAFTLSLVILIFHVSLKKTAQSLGKAAKKTYVNARQNMNRKGRPNAYRSDIPQQRPVNVNTGYSPFVAGGGNPGKRDVPIINGNVSNDPYGLPVEYDSYDPFNVQAKAPIDQATGFYNFGQDQAPGQNVQPPMEFGDRTISYGDKKVPVGEHDNSADFTYNSQPHHLPYDIVKKHEMYSFDKEDKRNQKEFYDLSDDGNKRGYYDHFEQGIPQADGIDAQQVDEEALYLYDFTDEDEPYEIENDTPGVRTPYVPVEVTDNLGSDNNVNAKPRGSNVVTAANSEKAPKKDDIKINAVDDHDNYSVMEGRKMDTSVAVKGASSVSVNSMSKKRKRGTRYVPAPTNLLDTEQMTKNPKNDAELKAKARKLEETLKSFGIDSKVVNITHGPTITRFELTIATGTKVSKVQGLADDIQMAMAAISVRIEAPIPGKSAIGIEIPNDKSTAVRLKGLLETQDFRNSPPLNVALGRDIPGRPMYCDLAKMPHLLIAGSTGSGKSVCLNSILISILCKASPDDVKLIMVDPKVVELAIYNGIPHLIMPVVTDMQKATNTLKWAVIEMERRYSLFAENAVRDLNGYNEVCKMEGEQPLPLIVVIIDEFADLMMVASKEVEAQVLRLAAKARAAGIHLILATQRPSVDVITGVLKNNLPSRIALAVTSGVDSKTILDQTGAEKLLGRGDMLYSPQSAPKPIRGQGAFVTDEEVEKIVGYLKNHYEPEYDENIMDTINNAVNGSMDAGGSDGGSKGDDSGEDELLEKAVDVIIEQKVASVSILQRRLGIGYPRAARLIDVMEQKKYIGPFEGSKPRKVLIDPTQWLEIKARNGK